MIDREICPESQRGIIRIKRSFYWKPQKRWVKKGMIRACMRKTKTWAEMTYKWHQCTAYPQAADRSNTKRSKWAYKSLVQETFHYRDGSRDQVSCDCTLHILWKQSSTWTQNAWSHGVGKSRNSITVTFMPHDAETIFLDRTAFVLSRRQMNETLMHDWQETMFSQVWSS